MLMAFNRPRRHYRTTEEDLIQIAYFDLIKAYRDKYEDLKMVYSIPNGLRLHPLTAQKAVDSGLTKGIWDVAIDVPRGTYHGARMEIKTPKGYLTKDQKDYKIRYVNQGFLPVVCRSCDEAWKFTLDYLGLLGLKNFYYGNYN
jgi:hypothetical protein